MKKRNKLFFWLPAVVCCGAFTLYYGAVKGAGDHTPPVITVPDTPLQAAVKTPREELMKEITATDDQDGDVTATMVVEAISAIDDKNQATVTYAAFDSAGNVAKAKRTIQYTDYQSPKFSLTQPLIFREQNNIDVFAPVRVTDAIDGDLTSRIKANLVSKDMSISKPGVYQVEYRVTNSLGDTEHLTLPVEVTARPKAQKNPSLTSYLIYLKKGSRFEPKEYIGRDSRGWPMKIETDLNTEEPGVYTVDYMDQGGAHFGHTRMIVVVEE